MSLIRPFRALRPSPEKASQVAAVPYDVVTELEARELVKNNRWSFLHVSRSEVDFQPGIDPHSEQVYQKASSNFKSLVRECPYLTEDRPALYAYRIRQHGHEQTGIMGCFSVNEYDSNRIKKHERTRSEKEDDRTHHTLALSAQTGPVFLVHRDVDAIQAETDQSKTTTPLYDFTADDGTTHTIWTIKNPDELVTQFSKQISTLYIADGHHRAAAASRTRAILAKRNTDHREESESNFFLALAFPFSQVKILPYHRMIRDLNGLTETDFLTKVEAAFHISPGSKTIPQPGEFEMFLKSQWYHLRPKTYNPTDLDVDILQDRLLKPILGINDPRTDQRIEFLGGGTDLSELEKKVRAGAIAISFGVAPTRLQTVIDVADRDSIMPPKSTWFTPKPRDGLLCHSFF